MYQHRCSLTLSCGTFLSCLKSCADVHIEGEPASLVTTGNELQARECRQMLTIWTACSMDIVSRLWLWLRHDLWRCARLCPNRVIASKSAAVPVRSTATMVSGQEVNLTPALVYFRELRCVVTQWPVQPRECTNLVSRQIALLAAIEH